MSTIYIYNYFQSKEGELKINHISVSRSKTYEECAKAYHYKYHLEVPNPGEEPFYFVYGKVVHKIAESYVAGAGAKSIGEVQQDVLRGKVEIEPGKVAPDIPAPYKRRMPAHLNHIKQITDKLGFEGHLEYPFRFDLEPPNEKLVVGFIDRLIIKKDKAFILDYKTTKAGKFRVNKDTVKTDLQLRTYARVVNREFGIKAENILCTLYYLEDGEKASAKFTEETLLRTEQELLTLYDKIANHDPEQVMGTTGDHCHRCVYKDMCPFFKGGRGGWSGRWGGGSTITWDGTM
jgi:PD-(D/E)XK nuclease superfamily